MASGGSSSSSNSSSNNEETPLLPAAAATSSSSSSKIYRICTVIILYSLSYPCEMTVHSQYILFRVASQYNLTGESDSTSVIQNEASQWTLYMKGLSTLLGLLTVPLFSGASDKFGRRGAILICLLGVSVYCVIGTATIAWQLSLWTLVLGSAVVGGTGGAMTLLASAYAFVADTTTAESRSLSLTVLDVLLAASIGLSQLGMGFWIAESGFFIPAAASAFCSLLNFVFSLLLLPESRPASAETGKLLTSPFHYVGQVFADFKRTGVPILLLLLPMATAFTSDFTIESEIDVLVLFATNRPLCMNSVGIGLYFIVRYLVVELLMLALVRMLIGRFHLLTLAAVGCLSISLFYAVLGLVQTVQQLLLSMAIVVFLGDAAPSLIRSFLSELSSEDTQGCLFGTLGALQSLGSFAGAVIVTGAYKTTQAWWSGFAYEILSAVGLVQLLLIVSAGIVNRMRPSAMPIHEGGETDDVTTS